MGGRTCAQRRSCGGICPRVVVDEDWTRALATTEIVFVSEIWGLQVGLATTEGFGDAETIKLLRALQCKLRVAHVLAQPVTSSDSSSRGHF